MAGAAFPGPQGCILLYHKYRVLKGGSASAGSTAAIDAGEFQASKKGKAADLSSLNPLEKSCSGATSNQHLTVERFSLIRGEHFHEFTVTQRTTPTSAVSNCLKIDFCRENFHESAEKLKICKSFLQRNKPALQYKAEALPQIYQGNPMCM